MQYLALALMEPPDRLEATAIADSKIALLRALSVASPPVNSVVRGQYVAGVIDGFEVPGYREESAIDPASRTETYLAVKLLADNDRWSGVPIYVRTGKRMHGRMTQISIVFKHSHQTPGGDNLARGLGTNRQVFRIQPHHGVNMTFAAKLPGRPFQIGDVTMDFAYQEAFPGPRVNTYAQLLYDAMVGDSSLFIRSDEVERSWEIVHPLQQLFADEAIPLDSYSAGSWGPKEADRLIAGSGSLWDNP